jgi:hypothetical protein
MEDDMRKFIRQTANAATVPVNLETNFAAALRAEIGALSADPDLFVGCNMGPASKFPDIKGKSEFEAIEAMVGWFNANFEDPAEATPYDSAEGGYQYIWGGPCDANEELEQAFYDALGKAFDEATAAKLIRAAVAEVEKDGYDWVPSQSRMQSEEPADELVAAKLKLKAVLDTVLDDIHCHEDREPPTHAQFNIAAVVRVLRALYELQRKNQFHRSALK